LFQYKSSHSEVSLREAIGLLARLIKAAEEGGRMGSVIEMLVLLALAHQIQNDIPAALVSLERALTLAEPEGYVRMFVDEGESVKLLIEEFRSMISKKSVRMDEALFVKLIPYTDRLLQFFSAEQSSLTNRQSKVENLVEPLSQRELDILRLFKTELSGPEIAQELVIALSTVRTHTKSIYSKLNVNSRRGAVQRAKEMGLI
jgi:LuxR family maltose regulon positive regulatory protein